MLRKSYQSSTATTFTSAFVSPRTTGQITISLTDVQTVFLNLDVTFMTYYNRSVWNKNKGGRRYCNCKPKAYQGRTMTITKKKVNTTRTVVGSVSQGNQPQVTRVTVPWLGRLILELSQNCIISKPYWINRC